ncbi:MAG: family N-acetyltransferase [Actinomycetia bacterium]|nr:family N-acetyltransferase [Actinomycetes bacterium]MDQ1654152.1 N-acetylglutamate synthase [Cryptosporangiaceae bacterium]
MLSGNDVGHRVVVRRVAGERDGRPVYSDILGELREWGDELVVRTADGRDVTVPRALVAAGKRIPIPPDRRKAPQLPPERAVPGPHRSIRTAELERVAARGWCGLNTEWLGGWLLRSAGGFTGRANSALPLGDPGVPVAEAIGRVERWYRGQGLSPLVQVPLPAESALRDELLARGWEDAWGALVKTAGCAEILDAVPVMAGLPEVVLAAEPDAGWLGRYHYRGGELPANALAVLRTGEHRRFASVLDEHGDTIAVARVALNDGWIGLTAVEVAPAHRRRGLATHLLRAAAEYAVQHAADSAYLQVEDSNDAAQALYGRAGFTVHHTYRYLRAPA